MPLDGDCDRAYDALALPRPETCVVFSGSLEDLRALCADDLFQMPWTQWVVAACDRLLAEKKTPHAP